MGRVQSLVARANQKLSVQLAATLLAGSTLLSALLGFARDRLLNSAYLPNEELGLPGYPVGIDAYTAAFMVPDFMFMILVSGALSVTFIPVFTQRLATGNRRSAWELSTSMINFLAVVMLVVSVLIIIFAEPLLRHVIAPGLDESGSSLAVSMMRVIAVNPFLFAIATVIASMQQALGRFTFFALAPTVYNIGIIIGIVFFTGGINIFGWQVFEGGIMGVALGVVLGSIMQLLVSAVGLIGLGFDYQFKIFWKNKGFRRVLRLLPARSIDQGMDYAVSLVEANLASRMTEGTLRIYQQATTLHAMPINLIGIAISNAAFPRLSERVGQNRPDLFRLELQKVMRVIIWMILPVSIITYFCRGYIVHFIMNGGEETMAGLLGVLVIAILFRAVYHIAARSFYARQDTRTPLYISIVAITLNIALAIWFTMELKLGPYGLAYAQSIVAVIEVILLFIIMSRQIEKLFDRRFVEAVSRMVLATAVTGIVCYIMVQILPLRATDQSFFSAFPKFTIITLISLGFYVLLCRALRLMEVQPIIERVKKLLFGRIAK